MKIILASIRTKDPAIFGRSSPASRRDLIRQPAEDEAIAEADTLLLTGAWISLASDRQRACHRSDLIHVARTRLALTVGWLTSSPSAWRMPLR